MPNLRRRYYDLFSRVYDRFVAAHSPDRAGKLRDFLADKAAGSDSGQILDLCTGTGALLESLGSRASSAGLIVGLDFSLGMLRVAQRKTRTLKNIHLIQADAGRLPFKSRVFDALTCSHAFYELKSQNQAECLGEVGRVLKDGSPFLMMEHEVPHSLVIRGLFYVRLISMGVSRAIQILRYEERMLSKYFNQVDRVPTPQGKSKLMVCRN
jgi:demethylmenaquinone methyltransferase/2-methoxy-6-polyprenyl-1,4-benzoquinol methylase